MKDDHQQRDDAAQQSEGVQKSKEAPCIDRAQRFIEVKRHALQQIAESNAENDRRHGRTDKQQPIPSVAPAGGGKLAAEIKADGTLDALFEKYAALEYDNDGNVVGGDEAIEGIVSKEKDTNRASEQLVVSTNAAFAPYEYKKGDKYAGIDMEIAKMIADKLGLELVIDDMDFDAVVTSVGKNGVDIAMAGLSVTATRKQSVNFSDPYYQGAYQVLVVKEDETRFDGCKTKEDVEALLKTK